MKGIFLTYNTVINEKGADAFIKYCSDNGFTDAFIQTGVVDRRSRVQLVPDMFDYIVRNRGSLNIHAHITTLRLWRDEFKLAPELRPEIKDSWLWLNDEQRKLDKTKPAYWCLDAFNKDVQQYLVDKCAKICMNNDIQGLYLERLYYHPSWSYKRTIQEKKEVLTQLLTRITSEVKTIKPIKVSVATLLFPPSYIQEFFSTGADAERCQDLTAWENIVDYLCPMIFVTGEKFDFKFNLIKDNPKIITTLGCYKNTIEETQRQITKLGLRNVALFAYGKLNV